MYQPFQFQLPKRFPDRSPAHPEIVAKMWEFIRASHTEPENPLFKMEIPEV